MKPEKLSIIFLSGFLLCSCLKCPEPPDPQTPKEQLDHCLKWSLRDGWGNIQPEKQLACYEVYEKALALEEKLKE